MGRLAESPATGRDTVESAQLLRQGIELLEQLATYDAEMEAKLRDGRVEELPYLATLRSEVLARLVAMGGELSAQSTCPEEVNTLRSELRRLAEVCFARTRDSIASLQQKIHLLEKEQERLQERVRSLKRYLGARNGGQTDLVC
ncbi:MAG: hypothetical protein H5U38_04525 [Calditrichaeota bacterium]|nr:hypothetical protein [Calditrichota bacterium]